MESNDQQVVHVDQCLQRSSNIRLNGTESPHTLPCDYIETLPPLCTDSAFSIADQPPPALAFEEWKNWGHTWRPRSCLFAEAACGAQKLCVKMALNLDKAQYRDDPEDCLAPSNVAVAQRLVDEWAFYSGRLRSLQGALVPRHYGLWTCHTSWGGVVLFAILEWAGVSAYRLLRQDWKDTDTMDYRLECVSAIRDLHLSGIQHGQLVGFNGIRHVLFDPHTKKARLIDFYPSSESSMHRVNMTFISNLFPRFFGKNPTPTSLDLPHEQTPAPYPWSTHLLQLLPPTVSTNTLRPGPAGSPTPPAPLSESPESPESPSPFPRHGHSVSASPVSHGDLYLFGGLVDGCPRNDVYLLRAAFADSDGGKGSSGTDNLSISASLFETGGAAPSPRVNHAGAVVSSVLVIWGGQTHIDTAQTPESRSQSILSASPTSASASTSEPEVLDEGVYLLDLVSHAWTRVSVHGPAPSARYGHAAASIGASFFVFGGHANGVFLNDIWVFTLNTLAWELCEPVAGDRPAPRSGHSCVAHGDNLIVYVRLLSLPFCPAAPFILMRIRCYQLINLPLTINQYPNPRFGGTDGTYHYHDTWAFDTRSRTWTELQCIGYIPAQREGHAASLVGDVMYVFGGRGTDGELGDAVALNITSRRWFVFRNMGPGPGARWGHAVASVGSRVVVLGGSATRARGPGKSHADADAEAGAEAGAGEGADDTDVVHVLDTGGCSTFNPMVLIVDC
ncbi:hypothetical protein PLEOSDRAFT_1107042 [Pleurotus ostreatus PC15]|uniref:Protein kinase domain-containing protein n=1 Tax=Pleurotus ostreatus (strain PC15) TaxID=1137138 RepID=A0A067NRC9_PLEO1|nr:hypothetical protein PLEOSDRAFT_1107042 [Pleurotus ostreatus PC15]